MIDLPHSEEDEVNLLGSMLTSKEDFYNVIDNLEADAFFIQEHFDLYTYLKVLRKQGYRPTPETLIQILKDNDLLEKCHGEKFIRNIIMHASIEKSADVQYHLDRILRLSDRRKLIGLSNDLSRDVFSSEDVYVIQQKYKDAFNLLSEDLPDEFVSADLLLDDFDSGKSYSEVLDERQYNHKNGVDNFSGFRTGYKILDEHMGGFGNGLSTIIGARSGSGKTTLLTSLLLNNKEMYPDSKIGFFTLEMSNQNILEKLAAAQQGIIYDNLVEGNITTNERKRLTHSIEFFRDSGFYLYDKPSLNIAKARSIIRKAIIKHDLEMVFTDYLTIMKPDKITGNVYQDTDQLSKAILSMSREFKIPFVTLAQLSRKPADRPDKTPQVSDLRNAGSIEEDADNIILLHRPAMYDATKLDHTELYLSKNRYRGRVTNLTLKFERGRLYQLPPLEDEFKKMKGENG